MEVPPKVNFVSNGIELTDELKHTKVFLQTKAWEQLKNITEDIDFAFKNQKICTWILLKDSMFDVRVHTSFFNDTFYLHIRHWKNYFHKDLATSNGVTLIASTWKVLKSYMVESTEEKLGKEVLSILLESQISTVKSRSCLGCKKDWCSQRDHACLMNETTDIEYLKAIREVTVFAFIKELAAKAYEQKVILEIPHQIYKKLIARSLLSRKFGARNSTSDIQEANIGIP